MSLYTVHHAILKQDALEDYEKVKAICISSGYQIVEPTGKHWHRIEDATAKMIKQFTMQEMDKLDLHRGVDYYCDL
jgi:hypothetical protein